MTTAVGVAFGAISALGEGQGALSLCELGALPRGAVTVDPALVEAGLARTASARIPWLRAGVDAAERLLLRALEDCARALSLVDPVWRQRRVGLALGSSSGGMTAAERAFALLHEGRTLPEDIARRAFYGSPFIAARAAIGAPLAREAHVLGACASSTIALGLAKVWLSLGLCDVVLAGGYDVLTTFVASGFSALGAVTMSQPAPFRLGRDGLGLGEGAAVVALMRADDAARFAPAASPCLRVAGFAVSSDATHITAPERTGSALVAASREAIAMAGLSVDDIGLVSAHGTATLFNDAAEAKALATLFGARVAHLPTHAMKGETGHTYGAAGVLEALSAHRAMSEGVLPATGGEGEIDPEAPVGISPAAIPLDADAALKLSLAFGGLNAALVLRARAADDDAWMPPAALARWREERAMVSSEPSLAELAASLGAVSIDKLARTDALTRLALAAVASLAAKVGREIIARSALIIGHELANVATNATYARRIHERGARAAEPRRFPYTSPNACAGEISIAFGVRGPALAVGGAPGLGGQASELAVDLCASRVASSCVVVEVFERSEVGDALLVASGHGLPERGSYAVARLLSSSPA